jgi:GNAT superfamily N-acetyltransferase
MLRVRPYSVFSIPLAGGEGDLPNRGDTHCQDVGVRWLETNAERSALEHLVDNVNLATWNGTTRRVAVAWRTSEPIGVAWIAMESFDEPHLGLRFALARDDAWLHSAFVAPSWRKQGVYRGLLQYVTSSLQAEGCRRLLLGVTTGNEPSRRAHNAFGAAKIGRIVAARSCGLSFCFAMGKVCCSAGGHTGFGRSIDLKIDR